MTDTIPLRNLLDEILTSADVQLADKLRMDGAKQMLCRNRLMVHCDAACFPGDPPAPDDARNDDVVWGDEGGEYGDLQSRMLDGRRR